MKNIIYSLFVFSLIFLNSTSLIFAQSAKRSAPPVVIDVVYNNIRYTPSVIEKGYVEAWNTLNNQLIWKKKAYDIEYNPTLESDVQDVFITSLKVVNNRLQILNERGGIYYIDLDEAETSQVQSMTSSNKIRSIIVGSLLIVSLGLYMYFKKNRSSAK